MKKLILVLLVFGIFISLAYAGEVVRDVDIGVSCASGFDESLGFDNFNGSALKHCVKSVNYNASGTFVIDVYLGIGVISCLSGYESAQDIFEAYNSSANAGTSNTTSVYVCKKIATGANESSLVKDVSLSLTACSGNAESAGSFVDGDGRTIYHCVTGGTPLADDGDDDGGDDEDTCSDTDDGVNYSSKGTCSDVNGTHADNCADGALVEFDCGTNNLCASETIECDDGFECVAGECVAEPTCVDTDVSNNVSISGTCTDIDGNVFPDECQAVESDRRFGSKIDSKVEGEKGLVQYQCDAEGACVRVESVCERGTTCTSTGICEDVVDARKAAKKGALTGAVLGVFLAASILGACGLNKKTIMILALVGGVVGAGVGYYIGSVVA